MKTLYITLICMALSLPCTIALAQTPFDAFSPETSRIILDGDSIAAWRAEQQSQLSHRRPTHSRPDTILCALIADLRNEQLLLVDIATHRPVAYAPFTDEIKNWLSVDPLVDKNITTSPYLYCNGNPVMFIDPDGRQIGMKGEDGEVYIYQEQDNQTGFYHNGVRLNSDYANAVTNSIDKIKSGGLYGRTMVEALEKDERLVLVKDALKNFTLPSGNYVYWSPTITGGGIDINNSTERPAFIGLAHEFAHVLSIWNKFCDYNKWPIGMGTRNPTKDEIWATYMENLVRMENGIPVRKCYAQNGEFGAGYVWGRGGPLYPGQFARFVGVYMKMNGL